MSTWRNQLLPASFRGVPFGVKSADMSGGRRVVKHEFPLRETAPFSEDMGKLGRTFAMEAFVVGDDYMSGRNALLDALEAEGPGTLIHPYHGTQRVTGTYRMRETSEDGGMAVFSLDFTLTSADLTNPTTAVDSPAQVAVSAAALKASAGAEFLSRFDELSRLRASVTGALTAATSAVARVLNVVAIPGQVVAELGVQIAALQSNTTALLNTPGDLVSSLTGLIEGLGAGLLSANAPNPLAPLLAIFSVDFGVRPPSDTPSRVIEQVNFDATQNLVKRLVLAQAALMAVAQTFESYEQAVAVRASIVDLIDAHCEAFADDVYPAIQQMRTDVVGAVPGSGVDLPHLVTFVPHATLPSLVLAHTLYGSLDREADIVRRNGIANPGFVAGGVALEVLADE